VDRGTESPGCQWKRPAYGGAHRVATGQKVADLPLRWVLPTPGLDTGACIYIRESRFHAVVAGGGPVGAAAAALSFDPLSSQGILTALYTGMRAGQAPYAHLTGEHGSGARVRGPAGTDALAYRTAIPASLTPPERLTRDIDVPYPKNMPYFICRIRSAVSGLFTSRKKCPDLDWNEFR
jgi:hypothetical protein